MTPSADSSASRLPDSKVTGAPIASLAAATNSGPFAASRAAAVAITWTSSTSMIEISTRNRRSAASAFSTPEFDSRPVVATPSPIAQSDFSLKIGVGARPSPS